MLHIYKKFFNIFKEKNPVQTLNIYIYKINNIILLQINYQPLYTHNVTNIANIPQKQHLPTYCRKFKIFNIRNLPDELNQAEDIEALKQNIQAIPSPSEAIFLRSFSEVGRRSKYVITKGVKTKLRVKVKSAQEVRNNTSTIPHYHLNVGPNL